MVATASLHVPLTGVIRKPILVTTSSSPRVVDDWRIVLVNLSFDAFSIAINYTLVAPAAAIVSRCSTMV